MGGVGDNIPLVRDVVIQPTLESWRATARKLLADGVAPEQVVWREAATQGGLFEPEVIRETPSEAADFRVPRAFVELSAGASSTLSSGGSCAETPTSSPRSRTPTSSA